MLLLMLIEDDKFCTLASFHEQILEVRRKSLQVQLSLSQFISSPVILHCATHIYHPSLQSLFILILLYRIDLQQIILMIITRQHINKPATTPCDNESPELMKMKVLL